MEYDPFVDCERDSEGNVTDPIFNDVIPRDRLVVVREGDLKWCMDLQVLLEGYVSYGRKTNALTTNPLSEEVLDKLREYRVKQLKSVVIVDGEKDPLSSRSFSATYVDSFDLVGDLHVRVAEATKRNIVKTEVLLEGVALTSMNLEQRVGDLTGDSGITVVVKESSVTGKYYNSLKKFVSDYERYKYSYSPFPSEPSGEREGGGGREGGGHIQLFWLCTGVHADGDFIWDVAPRGSEARIASEYEGQPIQSKLSEDIEGRSESLLSDPHLGTRVKAMASNRDLLPPVSLLYPWESKSFRPWKLLWYPIKQARLGHVWTLVEPGARLDEDILREESIMSALDSRAVSLYNRNSVGANALVFASRVFSPVVKDYVTDLGKLPDPDNPLSYAFSFSQMTVTDYVWQPKSIFEGKYKWDIVPLNDSITPGAYDGRPLPRALTRMFLPQYREEAMEYVGLSAYVKRMIREGKTLPREDRLCPWVSRDFTTSQLMWYPISNYKNADTKWTLVQPSLVTEYIVNRAELKIQGELSPSLVSDRVVSLVEQGASLPDPSLSTSYAGNPRVLQSYQEAEERGYERYHDVPIVDLLWIPVGDSGVYIDLDGSDLAEGDNVMWDIMNADDSFEPNEDYEDHEMSGEPLRILELYLSRRVVSPLALYYFGAAAVAMMKAGAELPPPTQSIS